MSEHQHTDPCGYLAVLSEYIDGDLDARLCRELEHHMTHCENCRIVVDTLQRTVNLYHTVADTEFPTEVEQRLWHRFHMDDLLEVLQTADKE